VEADGLYVVRADRLDEIRRMFAKMVGLVPCQNVEVRQNAIAAQEHFMAYLTEGCPSAELLEEAFTVLENSPELHPSNYDHDQVCELNAAACEAFILLREFLRYEEAGKGDRHD
jgi:hypothetical protein